MLRSKACRKMDWPPASDSGPDEDDDIPAEALEAFDPHCFCHDPVYRRLLGELLAELSDGDDDLGDDRPLLPN